MWKSVKTAVEKLLPVYYNHKVSILTSAKLYAIIYIMNTVIIKVRKSCPEKEILKDAAAVIRSGGLVAFPTETVYGLGADALRPEAAKKIYEAKGRPSDNPLIVHIADFRMLEKIVSEVPREARLLAEMFWPGPLTMILKKNDAVPYETTGGLDTVAVRMPASPIAVEFIRAAGGYIAAPSANTSGRPSPTTAEHVMADLGGKIPMILDGGPVGIGIESTIVDLSEDTPMILRPGYITRRMLEDVIGEVREDPALQTVEGDAHPKAPGMKYKHYAPKADLALVNGEPQEVVKKINALARERASEGKRTGVICTDETYEAYRADVVKSIGSRADEDAIAQHLYAILREFDDLDVQVIYSESFSTPRIGQAIMNRLLKAAGHHVIEAE